MPDHPAVEVVWRDIVSSGRWDESDPADLEPVVCRQLGYLVHRGADSVVIVNTLCADGGTGGATAIPVGCVVSITPVGALE